MSSGKIVQAIGPLSTWNSSRPILPDINNAFIVYKKTRKNKEVVLEAALESRGWCDPHHRNGIYRRVATRNGSHRYRCLNLVPVGTDYSRPSI